MLRSVTCGFSAVDSSGRHDELGDYLRTISDMDVMRTGKREAIEALELAPGARALDVGCGIGDDVRMMAARVAPSGVAVGIDASAAFVAEAVALARAEGSPADFVLGDAHALPWADGTFDAVRTERTLQHVEDPALALAEMVRVAAPGAMITVSEPDWDTLVIDLGPLTVTKRVIRAFRGSIRHPSIGRELGRMMVSAGLADVRVMPGTTVWQDASLAVQLLFLREAVDGAVRRGLEEAVGRRWLAEVRRRGEAGTFFAAATGFFVTGRKPL